MKVRIPLLVATALIVAVAVSCGGGEASSAAGGGDDMSVTIDAPADGDTVSDAFTVELSSSVPLGPTDTGKHHVHLYYDGDENDYDVVEADSFEVTGLDPGEHTILASLRNADHSEAGAEDELSVTVEGSSGGEDGGDGGDGGY